MTDTNTVSPTARARTMTKLGTRTPVEIDTMLAELDGEYHEVVARLVGAAGSIHDAIGDRVNGGGRRPRRELSDAQAVATLAEQVRTGTVSISHRSYAARSLETYTATRKAITANRAAWDRLNREWVRRPWTRFIQCIHIHSGYHCAGGSLDRGEYLSERAWRPELSGQDEATAIATLQRDAHSLCTKCFPDAPVITPAQDPTVCANTTADPDKPSRRGYRTGNWATCDACGTRATLTSTGALRKHKRPTPGATGADS